MNLELSGSGYGRYATCSQSKYTLEASGLYERMIFSSYDLLNLENSDNFVLDDLSKNTYLHRWTKKIGQALLHIAGNTVQ